MANNGAFNGSSAGGYGGVSGNSFNPGMFGSGVSGLLGGIFGNSDKPYENAQKQYNQWFDKAQQAQNPFYNAGVGATGNLQDWLGKMKDPSQFINNLMGQYQESPYAKYMQQQSTRSGTNAASASGLTGSTPFAQQLQQNSSDISSQDMNQWLQNVLGINTQYGQGNEFLSGQGSHSADILSNMFGNAGEWNANNAYNQKTAQDNDMWNAIGGGADIIGSFFM